MPGDVTIRQKAVSPAPITYDIPGAQELLLKSVTATIDGSGAGGSFVPCLQIIAPDGSVVGTFPCSTTLTAGASADVSWFPRGGVGGGGSGATDTFWPAADQAHASYDKTTWADTINGSGHYDALKFPSTKVTYPAFAIGVTGDAFPRMIVGSSMGPDAPVLGGIGMGEGTIDPAGFNGTWYGISETKGTGSASANIGSDGATLVEGGTDANSGFGVAGIFNGLRLEATQIHLGLGTITHYAGYGVPTIGGNVGDIYWRQDGGTSATAYVCTTAGAAGAAVWAPALGGSGAEIGYDQITTTVTVSSTTEATPTAIISCAAHTFDGAPVLLEVFFPTIAPQVFTSMILQLMESTTEITRLAVYQPDAAADLLWPGSVLYRFTPSAGSHTYTIAGSVGNATGYQIRCGAGGTATNSPGFARFVKV